MTFNQKTSFLLCCRNSLPIFNSNRNVEVKRAMIIIVNSGGFSARVISKDLALVKNI